MLDTMSIFFTTVGSPIYLLILSKTLCRNDITTTGFGRGMRGSGFWMKLGLSYPVEMEEKDREGKQRGGNVQTYLNF